MLSADPMAVNPMTKAWPAGPTLSGWGCCWLGVQSVLNWTAYEWPPCTYAALLNVGPRKLKIRLSVVDLAHAVPGERLLSGVQFPCGATQISTTAGSVVQTLEVGGLPWWSRV